ncbi:MAG TPA: ATP synthase F1 subunit epsilon [Actinomycetota bacterium]|nr:ATP synthase F1 subunit epsilon [Actinomycetota bacterium]
MATLRVTVVSPEREVFAGNADMVVARGVDGEVGILPNHAPMLIELAVAPVRLLEGEAETGKVLVDGGFLHVTPGEEETRVDVLAEHAVLPSEVDVAAARARAQEFQGRDDVEAQAELVRARMRAEHGTG